MDSQLGFAKILLTFELTLPICVTDDRQSGSNYDEGFRSHLQRIPIDWYVECGLDFICATKGAVLNI